MKRTTLLFTLILFASMFVAKGAELRTFALESFGIIPNTTVNNSPLLAQAWKEIQTQTEPGDSILLTLQPGRYNFYPEGSARKEYYISNHDQINPKLVAFPFEGVSNLTLDGQGAELIFHGRMLPISLFETTNCTLRNFSIDFATPHIAQVQIVSNNTQDGIIVFRTAPWVNYTIKEGAFCNIGEGWEARPNIGIAFEEKNKRLIYNSSDITLGTADVTELAPGLIRANKWKNEKLIPGTVLAFRTWFRPTPGIFLHHSKDTKLENIQVHYAEGMGLLAQMSENITMDGFSVCLRGENDPRYFTTQADATHFSGCKGVIDSRNGLYEGMMDDAINVHGTYLNVIKRIDNKTLVGRYMHDQAWGFLWGCVGDSVQFVNAASMELAGKKNIITAIRAIDKPNEHGAREFELSFKLPIPTEIRDDKGKFGIENLTWTPEVNFSNNVIRNNRARGSLFSTPRKTIIENNLFDHTSGTAILLCGDCNGWYETGACRDITIRNNTFINALTNQFQFTNAVISIYPEIPNLPAQRKYFHSGILIENNNFEMFDVPILYAKSVNGLIFRHNTIKRNTSYPAFHWNKSPFFFQRVKGAVVEQNNIEGGFDAARDIKSED